MSVSRNGLYPWLLQRATAIYMVVFLVFVAVGAAVRDVGDYQVWRAFILHPLVASACGLFLLALLAHAWVGVRNIVMDYISGLVARLVVYTLVVGTLFGFGAWAMWVLFGAGH